MTIRGWASFHVLIGYLCIFIVKCLSKVFCQLLYLFIIIIKVNYIFWIHISNIYIHLIYQSDTLIGGNSVKFQFIIFNYLLNMVNTLVFFS